MEVTRLILFTSRGCPTRSGHTVNARSLSELVFYQQKPNVSHTRFTFEALSVLLPKFPLDAGGQSTFLESPEKLIMANQFYY